MRFAVLIVALACERPSPEQPAARPPTDDDACRTLAPTSAELPRWFGDASAPKRRIEGTLYIDGAPGPGTVHLRIDAPDATVWSGRDVEVGRDGHFALTDLRAGAYTIVATSPTMISRAFEVDVSAADRVGVDVFAFPCWHEDLEVTAAEHRPVAGARIDLGGVVVATSDAKGNASVCVSFDEFSFAVRAPGLTAGRVSVFRRMVAPVALYPTTRIRGRVVDDTNKPAAHVAVEAMSTQGDTRPFEIPLLAQTETDASGQFVLCGMGAPPEPGQSAYWPRVVAANRSIDTAAHFGDAVIRLGDRKSLPKPSSVSNHTPFQGRVVSHGAALSDLRVYDPEDELGEDTRTRADGTFTIEIPSNRPSRLTVFGATGFYSEREVRPGQHGVTFDITMGEMTF